MSRLTLSPDKLSPEAAAAIGGFHASVVNEVAAAIDANRIVIVGMTVNPFVRKARALLEQKKLPYTYLEYGGYASKWKERLAIKIWSGWPTYPQVFVEGRLVGGYKELKKAMDNGLIR